MVSITSQVSSTYVVKFQEDYRSKVRRFSRRVSRVATLDGGSVGNDSGFSDTDRTLDFSGRVTKTQGANLKYMIENYALWNVVSKGEYHSCHPKTLEVDNGKLKLILLIEE